MAVSTRRTILVALKSGLESITTANGFQSTVAKVLRGIQPGEAFSGSMPGLAVWCEQGPRENFSQGHSERTLKLHVWGYVPVDAAEGDYDALDKLVADVEKCLMTVTYNPYWGDTEIGNTTYYEGGVEDPIGIFDMEVEISYVYEWASP